MSTRSRIGITNPDGTVRSIYCHSDGYPEYNGRLLIEHYTDPAKINELLDLGDISVLNENIGEPHDFDWRSKLSAGSKGLDWDAIDVDPCNKMVLAYGRDRGETNIDAALDDNADEMYRRACNGWEEFAYLFRNGEWLVTPVGGGAGPFLVKRDDPEGTNPPDWRLVSDVLAMEDSEANG